MRDGNNDKWRENREPPRQNGRVATGRIWVGLSCSAASGAVFYTIARTRTSEAASSRARSSSTCFARRIVGSRVSASMRTDFVLNALEQAIYAREGDALTSFVHHSDAG